MEISRGAAARAAGIACLLALLYLVAPPDEPAFRVCGFRWLTGRDCPLCGLTRALFALGKGQWSAALRFHALSPLALAMLLSLFWKWRWRERLWSAGVAVFGVYGVLRLVGAAG